MNEREIGALVDAALKEVEGSGDLEALEAVRVRYLGKKGQLSSALSGMAQRPPEERRLLGRAVNEGRRALEEALEGRRAGLKAIEEGRRLRAETLDVTLPGTDRPSGLVHPITRARRRIEDILIGLGYELVEGPEMEDDWHNFEALNFPPDHPARDMHDSFFVAGADRLLRTHTSPAQIRAMAERAPSPLKVAHSGRVFRRDDDVTHSPVFYQIEGLAVGRGIGLHHLKGTLQALASELFERRVTLRFRPSYFPFTEPSAEVDVGCVYCGQKGCRLCKGSGWIELLGSGMVHPSVLANGGYDPEVFTGLAFGIGIDRAAMLLYGIDDIRHLYQSDMRFLKSFRGVMTR